MDSRGYWTDTRFNYASFQNSRQLAWHPLWNSPYTLDCPSRPLASFAVSRSSERVTCLVSGLVNSKSLTAELQHFWHKRQAIETPIFVECGENLRFVSDFHNLSDTEFKPSIYRSCHRRLMTGTRHTHGNHRRDGSRREFSNKELRRLIRT